MKVHELIKQLQQLGIERQNDEITVIRDDFPYPVLCTDIVSTAYAYDDHFRIDYFAEVHDPEDGPLVSIVVIR